MKRSLLAILNGILLYLPFSSYNLWFLIFPGIFMLLRRPNQMHYLLTGFTFFFLSLRCVNIASIEYGDINPFLAYTLFALFCLFLTIYQMNLPLYMWKKMGGRLWLLPMFYTLFEVARSYVPYGGFPWLIVGKTLVNFPVVKHSLSFLTVYGGSLLIWYITYLAFKRKFLALLALLSFSFLLGLSAKQEVLKALEDAKILKVALLQTAVPQQDKLSDKKFREYTDEILSMVSQAVREKPDLVVLPESAFAFFFSDEFDRGRQELFELSYRAPILVGLVDIREGLKPYNSAYLIADGQLVGYYDKIRLLPIGEYMPFPFGFLKDVFSAISGLDYVPGTQKRPIVYKNIQVATPICFEIAYWDLVKELSKKANLVAVLTNDGWFNHSDCSYQHFMWAKVRAIENGKFILWVNNSGDTAVINPFGEVVKKMPYMKRGILIEYVRLLP
ncbi:apolipoprotein N-acyltransferase [Hydrogenobacter thermophilus]|uniref:apolipoprotein N-acyltransferase n=1 Tax=Hydrogenobacter thermophilus TaxID=940 RepID=UPI0030F51F04